MFSRFNPFTKKKKKQYAPNTKIAYRPNLIRQLTNEHQELLDLYQSVITSVERGNFEGAKVTLDKFKAKFTGHIIKENVNFYVYVQHSVDDSETLDLIRDMRSEMDDIAKAVRQFTGEYTKENVVLDEEFLVGFKEIGAALVTRINQEEEHLYPTYRPVVS